MEITIANLFRKDRISIVRVSAVDLEFLQGEIAVCVRLGLGGDTLLAG
jgi:hypothetical protein